MSAPTKRCRACKRDLPLTAFAKRAPSADGLQARCRECRNGDSERRIYSVARNAAIHTLIEAHRNEFQRYLGAETERARARLPGRGDEVA